MSKEQSPKSIVREYDEKTHSRIQRLGLRANLKKKRLKSYLNEHPNDAKEELERTTDVAEAFQEAGEAARSLSYCGEAAGYFTEAADLYGDSDSKAKSEQMRHDAARMKERVAEGFGKKRPGRFANLLSRLHMIGIVIAFLVSGFFLSPNLTANTIGNMSRVTSGLIGVLVLVAGIAGLYLYVKNQLIIRKV